MLVLSRHINLGSQVTPQEKLADLVGTETYWVQVEGEIDHPSIQKLLMGVSFRTKKKEYTGRATDARIISGTPLPPREPPIRERANIPTSWLSLTLTEGKHRQVRKMMAAIGFPVLRLVRYSIQKMNISDLSVGKYKEVTETEFMEKLQLNF